MIQKRKRMEREGKQEKQRRERRRSRKREIKEARKDKSYLVGHNAERNLTGARALASLT